MHTNTHTHSQTHTHTHTHAHTPTHTLTHTHPHTHTPTHTHTHTPTHTHTHTQVTFTRVIADEELKAIERQLKMGGGGGGQLTPMAVARLLKVIYFLANPKSQPSNPKPQPPNPKCPLPLSPQAQADVVVKYLGVRIEDQVTKQNTIACCITS